jgi:hypothetical protein
VTLGEHVATASAMAFVFTSPLFVRDVFNFWRGHLSKRWPHVRGVITSSGTVARGVWARPNPPRSYIVVQYDYVVAHLAYSGSRLRFHRRYVRATSQSDLKAIHIDLKVGNSVKVYFDPADPAQSVLEPGFSVYDVLDTIMRFFTIFWLLFIFMRLGK